MHMLLRLTPWTHMHALAHEYTMTIRLQAEFRPSSANVSHGPAPWADFPTELSNGCCLTRWNDIRDI